MSLLKIVVALFSCAIEGASVKDCQFFPKSLIGLKGKYAKYKIKG
jgi:hypothetical protein